MPDNEHYVRSVDCTPMMPDVGIRTTARILLDVGDASDLRNVRVTRWTLGRPPQGLSSRGPHGSRRGPRASGVHPRCRCAPAARHERPGDDRRFPFPCIDPVRHPLWRRPRRQDSGLGARSPLTGRPSEEPLRACGWRWADRSPQAPETRVTGFCLATRAPAQTPTGDSRVGHLGRRVCSAQKLCSHIERAVNTVCVTIQL